MDIQNINVWSVPVLLTFWNELIWNYEKSECENDDLITALRIVEDEIKKREWKYFKCSC